MSQSHLFVESSDFLLSSLAGHTALHWVLFPFLFFPFSLLGGPRYTESGPRRWGPNLRAADPIAFPFGTWVMQGGTGALPSSQVHRRLLPSVVRTPFHASALSPGSGPQVTSTGSVFFWENTPRVDTFILHFVRVHSLFLTHPYVASSKLRPGRSLGLPGDRLLLMWLHEVGWDVLCRIWASL